MVTKEQYDAAAKRMEEDQETVNKFFKEKQEVFNKRMEENPIFTDDELIYSGTNRFICGAGLAYPKDCGGNHYWDCSSLLKGETQLGALQHSPQYPFMTYSIHGESEYRGTTRPGGLK